MQGVNVKREIVFGIKWLGGLVLLLAAAMAANAQSIKRVDIGVRMPQARLTQAVQVILSSQPIERVTAAVATPVSLPDWNGTVKMFSPAPVVVLMDTPVDVSYIRRAHTGYTQIGPKLWIRSESK